MLWVAAILFAVAFAYANVGLGGGFLYFPILSHFYPSWRPAALVAATLLFSIATLLGSAIAHSRQGKVRWSVAMLLGPPMAVGSALGARLTLGASSQTVKLLFASVLLAAAVKMAADLRRSDRGAEPPYATPSWVRLMVAAFASTAIGFVSGSVGIGGGLLLLPLLVIVVGMETRAAVGTASIALIVTAAAGLGTYAFAGKLDLPYAQAALLTLVAFGGGMLGTRYGLRALKARHIRAAFIAMLFVAAAWTYLDSLNA